MICPKCGASTNGSLDTCSVCGGEIDTLAVNPPTFAGLESTKPKKELKKEFSRDDRSFSGESVVAVSDNTEASRNTAETIGNSPSHSKPKAAEADFRSDGLSSDIESLLGMSDTDSAKDKSTSASAEVSADDIEALLGISSGASSEEKPSADAEVSADDIETLLGISSATSSEEMSSEDTEVSAKDIDALLGIASSDKSQEETDIDGTDADDIEALLKGTPMQSDKSAADSSVSPKKPASSDSPAPNKISGKSDTAPSPKKHTDTTASDSVSVSGKRTVPAGGATSSRKSCGGNLGTVNPIRGIIAAVKGIFNFYGRSSRSEFCWGMPFLFAIVYLISANTDMGIIPSIVVIAALIAMTSLSVRRLHDIGKSWLGLWKLLIPYIGMVWLLFQLIFTSSEGKNEWGRDNH